MIKLLRVGIATVQEQRALSLAIAAGTRQRSAEEPQVWFPSVAAMARVLSAENMVLLKAVSEQRPYSMDALAEAVGKQAPNLSRSLHTMAAYGLVEFVKNGRVVAPQVTFEHLSAEFCLRWLSVSSECDRWSVVMLSFGYVCQADFCLADSALFDPA